MHLIKHIPAEVCQNIRGVFFDIDDTVTTDGRLEGSAYLAIEKLHQAGRHRRLGRRKIVAHPLLPEWLLHK